MHDEQKLFEFLILEGMQAGLSWLTILNKRENLRLAYDNFDVQKVACYEHELPEHYRYCPENNPHVFPK